MRQELLDKYNVPVPRYTSYPPANFFHEGAKNEAYRDAILESNTANPRHISFYVHIPFCKHLCHYCGCNSFPMMKPEVVERYVQALHKEIDQVKPLLDHTRKIAQIHYGGGSPTGIPVHYIKELNEHMLEGFETIEQPEIAIECHPGYLSEEDWIQLTDAKFTRFSLGVQDFKLDVLKLVNRRPSLLPMETVFQILRERQAKINMDFIYGLPLQTPESFAETIEKAASLQPDRLVTFSYAHVPWVNKRQLILEKAGLPTSDAKSKMYDVAMQIMHQAGYKSIGLDHFVRESDELYTALTNGQLHRNFQGYCTRRTTGQVYAFGVTGISQLNAGYAQNNKDIKQYMEQIEQGHFAVAKGYTLNSDEQITKAVIDILMCNYHLNWNDVAAYLNKSVAEVKAATAYNEATLRQFADDGIIEWDTDTIRITEEGTLFVRNVAASLDKLMLNTTKTFSKPV